MKQSKSLEIESEEQIWNDVKKEVKYQRILMTISIPAFIFGMVLVFKLSIYLHMGNMKFLIPLIITTLVILLFVWGFIFCFFNAFGKYPHRCYQAARAILMKRYYDAILQRYSDIQYYEDTFIIFDTCFSYVQSAKLAFENICYLLDQVLNEFTDTSYYMEGMDTEYDLAFAYEKSIYYQLHYLFEQDEREKLC